MEDKINLEDDEENGNQDDYLNQIQIIMDQITSFFNLYDNDNNKIFEVINMKDNIDKYVFYLQNQQNEI